MVSLGGREGKMNQHVPGFLEAEEDCSIPESSGFSRPKRLPTGEDDIMELLWRNGQVVVQRSTKRGGEIEVPAEQLTVRGIRSSEEEQHLFIHEDEMSSWLQYPIDYTSFDRDLYADLMYSVPPPPPPPPPPCQALVTAIAPPRSVPEIRPHLTPTPPIALQAQKPESSPRFQNFVHFSRHPCRQSIDPISKPLVTVARESTVVESNETPAVWRESRASLVDFRTQMNTDRGTAALNAPGAAAGKLAAGRPGTCELTVSSSPGGSGSSFSASGKPHRQTRKPTPAEERKRKIREADDDECRSEENDYEEGKRQGRVLAASSSKRSRAAEVHNLSERRRRDRINEKMKALQQLIPRCNKTDKASMLDEAIEYLKSLQLQVQMMSSMGCGMVPVMYPGMQRFMPAMGMGMDMAMNRPMLPYPSMQLPGSGLPNQASPAPHMGAGFHIPTFHLPPVIPVPDSSRIQAVSSLADPMLNPLISLDPNQPRMPNFVYPYHQFPAGFQQASQLPLPQNQVAAQPSTSKETGNMENRPSAGRK